MKYLHNLEFLYVLTATMGKDETNILSPRESAKLIAENSDDVKIHTEGVDKIAKHVRNVNACTVYYTFLLCSVNEYYML